MSQLLVAVDTCVFMHLVHLGPDDEPDRKSAADGLLHLKEVKLLIPDIVVGEMLAGVAPTLAQEAWSLCYSSREWVIAPFDSRASRVMGHFGRDYASTGIRPVGVRRQQAKFDAAILATAVAAGAGTICTFNVGDFETLEKRLPERVSVTDPWGLLASEGIMGFPPQQPH